MTHLTKSPHKTRHDQLPPKRDNKWAPIGKLGAWIFFWLVLIDLGINLLFPFPKESTQTPSAFESYFDYGRSIESKLERMVKNEVTNSDPIVASGWIAPKTWQPLPQAPQIDHDLLVAVYGMSFANQAARALADVDGKITLRMIAGPSAPPSHSFAAFMADTEGKDADVAMMGILASSVKRMRSISGMNWTYEHPAPYTYPHYTVEQDELVAVEPVIMTADEFVEAFNNRDENWQRLQQQMKQYDAPFDAFVFHENLTDHSAIVRLIRRGWANRQRGLSEAGLYDLREGFNPDASEIQTLKVMLTEFVATARASGQTPVILLINNQGYSAHLHEVLSAHVESLDALMLSTHTIVPSDDPRNFIADGHFTPEANQKIGQALQKIIRKELATHQDPG
ncbi:MAG: hypothetical protein AAGF01_17050 [Cyanobacteria bacterium P01_G01_bin.38]